jgi:D-hydantoinase
MMESKNMSCDLLIKGGKIVTPEETKSADLAISGGKIQTIGAPGSISGAKREIDANGKHILPGIVDPHAHMGYEDTFDNLASETRAAACGGVTTLGIYVLVVKDGIIKQFDGLKERFEKESFVDAFWHLMVIDAVTTNEIQSCPEEIGMTSFKFNMGYKGPHADLLGITATDDGAVFKGFSMIAKQNGNSLAACHCENIDIHLMLRDELIAQGRNDYKVWNESRPPFVEAECMHRAIYLAKNTNCPLYIPHITIAEGVDIIEQAHKDGLRVTGETCPQYLTHNNEEGAPIFESNPACGNVNPPIRDKASNDRLWEGIRDGIIECVGSDLAPCTLEMKGDNIWEAPMGLGNISELLLPIMLSEGVNKGRIPIETVVKVCSKNPAKTFGVYPQKGSLEEGSDADIVIVDLEKEQTVSTDKLKTIVDWSIYDGWKLKGWPTHTILGGELIVEDGEPVELRPGQARYLARQP